MKKKNIYTISIMSDKAGELITMSTDTLVAQCQKIVGSKTNIGITVVVIILLIISCLCCSSFIAFIFKS